MGYPSGSGGWSESITIPIGVSVAASQSVRFVVEGGELFGWEQFNGTGFGTSSLSSNVAIGGYGTIGIQLTFGER